MNLHALRLFYVAASYESITKASEILSISQPSITSQIKALEETYDVNLFVRKGRAVVLTDLGKEVFIEAQKLFGIETQIEHILNHENMTQSIRIDGSRLVMNQLLPEHILRYKNKYPKTNMSITHHHRHEVINNLLNYKTDVGFVGSSVVDKNLLSFSFASDELILVAHKDHVLKDRELSLLDLRDHEFYTTKKGSNLRLHLDRLFDAKIKMEFSDIYELLEYLSHDRDAIALCSRSVVKSHELIELKTKEPLGMNYISVLIRKRDEKVRVIRDFLDFMGVNLK